MILLAARAPAMVVPVFQVDAFADRPFAGNPAAVALLTDPAPPIWMQAVAGEMNLSETAFLHPVQAGWSLRWFTPTVEVQLCGHATLASAHVLWESGRLDRRALARFETASGILSAKRRGDEIELDFPAKPAEPSDPPPGLAEALGVAGQFVGRSDFDYLVEVGDAVTVLNMRPDFARLKLIPVRGVIVTSRSNGSDFDFVSRFFAPAAGVNEDPVTGSAHCTLGPFWQERLGKSQLRAYQASRRGGCIGVTVAGDRVRLAGRAITVMRGELMAPPPDTSFDPQFRAR